MTQMATQTVEVTRVSNLSANENPLGPGPAAVTAMRQALERLHRYPPQDDLSLRQVLAACFGRGLTSDNFLAANGGVEVLGMIEDAVLADGGTAIICPPCFAPYRVSLRAKGYGFTEVPLTRPDFRPDVDAILAAVTDETRLLYLTNPNNPTGTWFGPEVLDRILDGLPEQVTVIYDEVYWHFAAGLGLPDSVGLIGAGRNLVAVHSFSKAYGMAGARVGYALAPEALIARIAPLKRSYQLNTAALAGAVAALGDTAHLARTVANNDLERARLVSGLRALGLETWESAANFAMFRCPEGISARALCDRLAEHGVLVRPAFDLPDHVRASVGTPEEVTHVLRATEEVLRHV
ncbi:MAG: histidinol-phosphate transaminase [Pseudodonghicola sp.]